MRVDFNPALLNDLVRENKTEKNASATAAAVSNQAPGTEVQAPGAEIPGTQIKDTLTLSIGAANGVAGLKAQALDMPEVRQDKIAPLRYAILKGEYNVSSEEIADAMLKEQEF